MDFLYMLLLILFNDPISSKFLEKLTMGKKKANSNQLCHELDLWIELGLNGKLIFS